MDEFNDFISTYTANLKLIARATKGDYQLEDVINEAWLMAQFIQRKTGMAIAFHNANFQDLLLAYLHQHLVKYQDKKLRSAKSIDAPLSAHTENTLTLSELLPSDEGHNPVNELSQHWIAETQARQLAADSSQAKAYVLLLSHFRNMRDLARYLRISRSYAYRRCARAHCLKSRQHDLSFDSGLTMSHVRAWRKDKYCRPPRQLAFDFEYRLPLE